MDEKLKQLLLRYPQDKMIITESFNVGCHAQAVKDQEVVKWILKYNRPVGKLLDEILIDLAAAEIKE